MSAFFLHPLALQLFLFCISLNYRQPIWTSTTQDQQISSLHILQYTSTWPFPATIANSHKTIRAEEIIFCHHHFLIIPDPSNMNINSYALALTDKATKSGRKASKILASPVRPEIMSTKDWPAIAATTPGSQSKRPQGNTKKGKFTPTTGTQRKLNAFFALAQADKKKFASPPCSCTKEGRYILLPADVADAGVTPYSPPSTKRFPAGTKPTEEPTLATPSTVTLSPLGKVRGKAPNDSIAAAPTKRLVAPLRTLPNLTMVARFSCS